MCISISKYNQVCVYIYIHTQIRVFHNWVYIKYYLKNNPNFTLILLKIRILELELLIF